MVIVIAISPTERNMISGMIRQVGRQKSSKLNDKQSNKVILMAEASENASMVGCILLSIEAQP